MSKRNRGSFTGGSGDIKPQILTISSGTAASVSDYVTNQVNLPVPRIGQQQKKAMILELLRSEWYVAVEDTADTSTANFAFLSYSSLRSNGDTSTYGSFADDLIDPGVFAAVMQVAVLTTSGVVNKTMPVVLDHTDSNGNGILIATDRINITMGNIGGTTGASAVCKLYYRMVNVGITEYVGIVQSQQ